METAIEIASLSPINPKCLHIPTKVNLIVFPLMRAYINELDLLPESMFFATNSIVSKYMISHLYSKINVINGILEITVLAAPVSITILSINVILPL
ncbi:hypothetical protein [Heliorestis acidaminivorans]|uniref:hypothetical protein n=1 Tax=Heliorestis acidaminivorans TaxID=553427 RepID=UPI001478E4E5|nr:hypothetical protein [Heliorestis acidaminivorans]